MNGKTTGWRCQSCQDAGAARQPGMGSVFLFAMQNMAQQPRQPVDRGDRMQGAAARFLRQPPSRWQHRIPGTAAFWTGVRPFLDVWLLLLQQLRCTLLPSLRICCNPEDGCLLVAPSMTPTQLAAAPQVGRLRPCCRLHLACIRMRLFSCCTAVPHHMVSLPTRR